MNSVPVYLLDLSTLKRNDFTTRGMHLCTEGKKKLSYLVVWKLQKIIHTNTLVDLNVVENNANLIAYCQIEENLENSHFDQVVDDNMDYDIKSLL